MNLAALGRLFLTVGVALIVVGAALWLFGRRLPAFRIPGDIVLQRGPLTVYLPLGLSLLASLVLTGLLWLVGRWRP